MKRLWICAVLIMTVLFVVPQRSYAVESPDIQAKNVILVETSSKRVLYDKNAQERCYPASTTKIMTTLLALEHLNLDDMVTVSETALQNLNPDGSTANLVAGETLTVKDLLYCVMLKSANEACNVLAEEVAGSVPAFVDMMNAKAQEIGCVDTHFVNPHGLHDPDHYTTAYDLYLIAMEARKQSMFLDITHTESYEVKATNKSAARILKTTNGLIAQQAKSPHYYPGAKGIKTGYTTPAGHCLVSLATKNSMELLCVVMGAGMTADQQVGSFTESIKLLDWGFGNFERRELVAKGEPVLSQAVAAGKDADLVNLVTGEGVETVVPKDFDKSTLKCVPFVDVKVGNRDDAGVLIAPVQIGQQMGTVDVMDGDTVIATLPLVTDAAIERSEGAYVGIQISAFYQKAKVFIWGGAILLVLLIVVYIVIAIQHNKKRKERGYRDK